MYQNDSGIVPGLTIYKVSVARIRLVRSPAKKWQYDPHESKGWIAQLAEHRASLIPAGSIFILAKVFLFFLFHFVHNFPIKKGPNLGLNAS